MASKYSLLVLSFSAAIVTCNAHGATGNLLVFDDADRNGFFFAGAICSNGASLEAVVAHSGSAAIGISRQNDNNGGGWLAPQVYSASRDYDGVTFWVNSGNTPSAHTSLAIYDMNGDTHFMHLEDMYGGPLPANTWIQFQVPFASDLFAAASSTPPETVQTFCVITHSANGGPGDFIYLDDVSLNGADIFKDGFGN